MEERRRREGARSGAPFFVPFLRHRGFVGREGDLAKIHALLQQREAVGVRPVAAAGMGGIGKTQIAVEYAYRYASEYPGGVYWVNAAGDAQAVQAEIARLAEAAGIREDGHESERWRRLALAFARVVGGRGDALVIFDNVEDPRSLAGDDYGFVPAQMKCRLLFTTRRRDAGDAFATVPVGGLPGDESLELLTRASGRAWGSEVEVASAREVCRMLGELPLALALAGAYLKDNEDVAIGDYRDRLKREGALAIDDTELEEKDLPTRHAAAVGATLRLQWDAMERLPKGCEAERLVLSAAALLEEAAEVPRARLALLTGLGDKAEKGYPAKLGAALRRLVGLSLVEELGEKAVRLHPLVRAFAEKEIEAREELAAECAGRLGEALWGMGRLNDEVIERGVDAVLEDLRVAAQIGGEEERAWIGRLIRPLDREAHYLRRWDSAGQPGFLLQEVRNRCFELGEEEGCARAEEALGDKEFGWLRERLRVSRESEALVRTLEGHIDVVSGVAMTPDGRHAVSASGDGTLKVWDVASGQLVRTLEGHLDAVSGVAVTSDGRHAVSASYDKTLKVWDVASGQLLRTLEGHASWVTGVAVMPNGRQAVSASGDGTLKVWDVASGQLVRTLVGHTQIVTGVAVTPDGRHAVSTSWDETLKVWDVASGQLLRTLKGHTAWVSGVAVTPDSRHAISASGDETLKVWDVASGQLVRTLKGHAETVTGVAVAPDGRHAVSASYDKTLKVWDVASGQLARTLEGHSNWVTGVAVTPDGRHTVSASYDKTLKVWDAASGQRVHRLEGHASWVTGVAVTADGRHAVSASWDKTLKVWDVASGQLLRTLKGHAEEVMGVAVTPDGRHAVSASYDKTLKVWDVASGQLLRTLRGHTSWVTAVAVTPDGRHAISASVDETLKVWDVASGQLVRTLEGHGGAVNDVAVTPNGHHAISTSYDRTLKVWDVGSGQLIRTLEGHAKSVTGVAVTPDGHHTISASSDKTLKVWDVASGRLARTLEWHMDWVLGVVVTPNGRHAVSASNALRMWSLETGHPIAMALGAAFTCCATAPGTTILAGDRTGALHILDWLPHGRFHSASATPSPPLPPPAAPFRHRLPTARVMPIRTPPPLPPRADEPSTKPVVILFLAANPTSTDQLKLDEEMRAIDDAMRKSALRDRFDLRSAWAVRPGDLQELLLRYQPTVVHFSAHGSPTGELALAGEGGKTELVSAKALSSLFTTLRDDICCVVLNACYSQAQASGVAESIDCVIGMRRAVPDELAIEFAAGFYLGLGYGRSLKNAFEMGCDRIGLASKGVIHRDLVVRRGSDDTDPRIPVLIAPRGDPAQMVLVRASRER